MTHVPGHPLDQPMPGPDAEPAPAPQQGALRVGRLALALGTLAVLAVGIVVGLVVRGSTGTAQAATSAAGRGFPGGAAAGEGFPGSSGLPGGSGFGGPGGRADGHDDENETPGEVSDLSGSTFTLTTPDGSTVHVTIGASTTVTLQATGTTSAALADGDTVTVAGTESNGSIAATAVREGTSGGFGR